MSEETPPSPPYHASPAHGEGSKRLVCPVCGSPEHSAISTLPFWGCIRYLLGKIVTLQGELYALWWRLARCPEPCITTYAELSAATGIPIARLEALGVFAPEPEAVPQTQAAAAVADAAQWGPARVALEHLAAAEAARAQFAEEEARRGTTDEKPRRRCTDAPIDSRFRCVLDAGHTGAHVPQEHFGWRG